MRATAASVAALVAAAAAGCQPRYDLARTAAAIPKDRAIVVGLVPQDGKRFWFVELDAGGADLELSVPRAGNGLFVWSLPPGEYRIVAMRRTTLDTSSRGSTAGAPGAGGGGGGAGPLDTPIATESRFPAGDTPWMTLEPGGAYCLGTLAADERPRAFFGSVKGGAAYDANCDFSFLSADHRIEARWPGIPWSTLKLERVPTVTPR